jgi:hypothetical protein
MKHKRYTWFMIVMLVTALLLSISIITIAEAQVSFTITELSIESDLNSISLFRGGVIAVGRSGAIVIAYMDGEKLLEKPLDLSLLDVSCTGSRCLAIGERGTAVIVDVLKKTFKPVKLSDEDLKNVEAYGDRFYISTSKQVIEYSPDSGISTVFNIEATDILPADKLYILTRDKTYYVDGGSLRELKAGSYIKLAWLNGVLYGLSRNGLHKVLDNERVLEGSYERVSSCEALYLSSGSTIYRFDGVRAEVYAILPFKPREMACRDGEVYAVGEKGYYAKISRSNVGLFFAPSGRYVTVSADSSRAYVAGDRVLSYVNGLFRVVEAPSVNYIASSTHGDTVALLSQDRIVIVSDAGVKILPYTVGGYSDIWFTGDSILLAGKKGLVEVSVSGMASREIVGGVELYAVNGYGAAGKSALIVLSSQSAETVKVNGTMRGLDRIPCGLTAVGDIGLVAYRDGKTYYYRVPGGEKLRSIAVKPDGAYALIGGTDGGLYFWDGYRIQQLPYKAPREVTDIAWLSDSEALITAGGSLLLYRDLGHGEPSLSIQAPDMVKLYNGTERALAVTLNPLNGFGGELGVSILPEGLDGLWAEAVREKVYVKPMCPVQAEFRVSASPGAGGSGKLFIAIGGEKVELPVVVEPKTRQAEKKAGGILEDPVMLTVIGASAMLAATFYVISRMLKGVRRAPKPEEAEKPRPSEGGEKPEGGREW